MGTTAANSAKAFLFGTWRVSKIWDAANPFGFQSSLGTGVNRVDQIVAVASSTA